MFILKILDKLFLSISFLLWGYISYLLLSNVNKGFDITDESYYLLTAMSPSSIFSTLMHEGYYTGLLYSLSGGNIGYFRAFGIIILLIVSIWLSREVYTYLTKKLSCSKVMWDQILFSIAISTSVLSYYKLWILTPSYNWLAMISVILFYISLLRVINNKQENYNKYITLDYILLSFSFNLAFIAKPTVLLILIMISILFLLYEYKNIKIKKALFSVSVITTIMVGTHILILDGGVWKYYYRLIEGMERLALMGGGHTIESRYDEMIILIQKFFFEYFYFNQISNIYIISFMGIVVTLLFLPNKIKKYSLDIYILLTIIIWIWYIYALWKFGLGKNYELLWIRGIEILFLNFILIFINIFFIENKIKFLKQLINIVFLVIVFLLGSIAHKFGSNNHIIHAMSSSIIFVVISMLILSFIVDNRLKIRFFTGLSGLVFSIFTYLSLVHALEHPYRMINSVENQKYNVDILGGIKVDKVSQHYINELKDIGDKYRIKNKKIALIDMTGGTPGANVILKAEFFDTPWLLGAYPGSNKFLERILKSYVGTKKLKNAWILTAPNGIRKLNLNILKNIGLDFPNDYIQIGILKTAHRNENQELWKPKFN